MMKRIVYLHAVLLCLLSIPAMASLNLAPVPNHLANPVPFQQLTNQDFIVVYGSGLGTSKAKVTSTVYKADAGGYIYAYQISNATVKFSWFSVALDPILVTYWGVQVTGSETSPTAWDPVDDPSAAINMEASFSPGLTASNNSAILWFTCADTPSSGVGALAMLAVNGGVYAQGTALVPLPEPLTAILLGGGWILLRMYKHKKA
jgi:hypothetical protein